MKKNKTKKPPYITLKEFDKRFTPEEMSWIEQKSKYYELLFIFQFARKSRKITQEKLAKKAKINRTTLSEIETGQRNATLDVMMRLAAALDMNLEIKLS
ncbi:MAG: hypothetical protein A2383_03095 [Candidatus Pacebacteria bacterium RIFOXYB1_FULL_39_46]|nr:MAG: hypothetical protein A2182_01140 [Candidatus Pacebacteria bacterium RIFOXYA1_FULL_38_18]OGJ38410.1 MAG: hypothetical protein A2383_03095 [Candidatus Pacebacteria bacterium RIFOXYB1_FULL_39_46]OGJ40271.1 MAG: hypothetical protein A2411_03240 [Candidatus Pacebacteria bacterium RIFOXYC1_FULL_39_21]OGJ40844.1 MAG: hypothetical protein A2582_01975 [Candidatus Pacebacteria bacterium RIFOXYD1_FULL_39_27]